MTVANEAIAGGRQARVLWVGDSGFVDPLPGACLVSIEDLPSAMIASVPPAVVVVAGWPLPDGRSLVESARDLGVPVVVIGRPSGEVGHLRRAVALGASAVLPGRVRQDTLRAAIGAVCHGQVVLAPQVLDGVAAWPRRPARGCGLSRREQEVMSLVALGHTNSEIAEELHIAEKTVKNHLNRIFTRLGVATRTGAVAEFLGLGMPAR